MTIQELVLDTNVLCVAASEPSRFHRWAAVVGLLAYVAREGKLVLDIQHQIQKEYEPYLDNPVLKAWFSSVIRAGRCQWYSSHVPKTLQERLSTIGFDPSDFKFVGVALRTADHPHYIVNEVDSDWNGTVQSILGDYDVVVVSSEQIMRAVSDRAVSHMGSD